MAKDFQRYIKSMKKEGKDDFVIMVSLEAQGRQKEEIEKEISKFNNKIKLKKQFFLLLILTIVIILIFYVFFRVKFYNGNLLPEDQNLANYMDEQKIVSLRYFLNGKYDTINFSAYDGLYQYYKMKSKEIPYFWKKPDEREILSYFIEDKMQTDALAVILRQIRQKTNNSDDQARIAISLVQLIPYEKGASESTPIKYPYEVIYTNTGVCSDKTKLLILLLRELDFGVAEIKFMQERHDAVGISCPVNYSYKNSGYCFVETTSLGILTDDQAEYAGKGKLESVGKLIEIYSGKQILSVNSDYNDLIEIRKILEKKQVDIVEYDRIKTLLIKYGYNLTKNST